MQQNAHKPNELNRYLALLWKRKWFVVIPTLVFGIGASYYSMTLPDEFKSTTLILVTPQKVPEHFVPSTVTTDIQDRLSTISQQILSRTALEKVIQEFRLFEKAGSGLTAEEKVERMRRNIKIDVHKDASPRKDADSFEVSYVASDPRQAMLVTAKIASLFIDENLKVREQQAMGTSQFLADEIDRYKTEVEKKEKEIYDFKTKNMDQLSDQLASNQARLAQLQNQLQINTQSANAAKDRKVVLQQQLSDIEKRVNEERERLVADARARLEQEEKEREAEEAERATGVPSPGSTLSPLERELLRAREELATLRLTHREKHPDVQRLAANVKRLEAEVADGSTGGAAGANVSGPKVRRRPGRGAGPNPDQIRVEYPPTYFQIRAEIAKAESEAARLHSENAQIQKAIEVYQVRIAAGPTRELQMKQLSEGYKNVKAVLDNLMDKKLQADLSENMEKKQKGEQFRILDPANLPEKPFSPNRMTFVGGGFLGGAAAGVGLILLLDFLVQGVRSRDELADLGMHVLGVVPEITTAGDLLRRRKLQKTLSGAAAAALVVLAVTTHFAVKPLHRAAADLYRQARDTYWTTMK